MADSEAPVAMTFRSWPRVLFALVVWLALPVAVPARQVPVAAAPEVTVTGKDGRYAVAARFHVAQPAAVALAVLSDYEAIPRIIPDIRRSVIVQHAPQLVVAQEAVSQYGVFSRTVHLELEVTVAPDRITFVDRLGRSFTEYHGQWQLEPEAGGTAITYALTARPAFRVPGFMISRIMSRDARTMIARLSRAMALRAAP